MTIRRRQLHYVLWCAQDLIYVKYLRNIQFLETHSEIFVQNDEGEIDQPVSVLTVEFEGVDFVFGYGADFNLLDT